MAEQNTENRQVAISSQKGQEILAADICRSANTIMESVPGAQFPEGYNPEIEARSAVLALFNTKDKGGKSALDVVPKGVIMTAVRRLLLQGLSVDKAQAYPIVYGSDLNFQTSYFGDQTVLKRLFPDYEINANCVHEGDEFKYRADELGFTYITNWEPTLEGRDKPIIAAFAVIFDRASRQRIYTEVMSWKEIQTSWSQAKTKNVQEKFPSEMAKRTVIRRAIKSLIRTSDMKDPSRNLVRKAYLETEKEEFIDDRVHEEPWTEEEMSIKKIVSSKSRGTAGLKDAMALRKKQAEDAVEAEPEKTPQNASGEPDGETIPVEAENASTGNPQSSGEDIPEGMDPETGEIQDSLFDDTPPLKSYEDDLMNTPF